MMQSLFFCKYTRGARLEGEEKRRWMCCKAPKLAAFFDHLLQGLILFKELVVLLLCRRMCAKHQWRT